VEPVFEVFTYETADGKVPFDKWFLGIRDGTTRARIETRIDRLALGNFSNCEPAKEGVTECKMEFGPGYRVYFGIDGAAVILLLIGGKKDTQDADMDLARKYWRDYKDAQKSEKL
jgi:putative addiction module killer protein